MRQAVLSSHHQKYIQITKIPGFNWWIDRNLYWLFCLNMVLQTWLSCFKKKQSFQIGGTRTAYLRVWLTNGFLQYSLLLITVTLKVISSYLVFLCLKEDLCSSGIQRNKAELARRPTSVVSTVWQSQITHVTLLLRKRLLVFSIVQDCLLNGLKFNNWQGCQLLFNKTAKQ